MAARRAWVIGWVSAACSVPSAPAQRPEPDRSEALPSPAQEPTPPFSLPPADRLCSADCCPRDVPVVQVGSPVTKRPSGARACLVGDVQANELVAGLLGDVLLAGGGNDLVRGGPARDTILGDDGDDELHAGPGSDHVDGGFGIDVIEGGEHPDLILGGPGADTIHGDQRDAPTVRFGADVIHGGPGSDTIEGGYGEDQILGGVDDDTLRGGRGNDQLFGGRGNDRIDGDEDEDHIQGEAGDDVIHGGDHGDRIQPGLGRDESFGDEGDDTFVFIDECSLVAGEVVDGGPGYDRVYAPWSEAEMIERGIRVRSIESFVNPKLGMGKECELEDPRPEVIEVSGTVVASEPVFRDEQRIPRPLDGQLHTEWDIHTRHTVAVDTVYLGNLQVGAEIQVLLPGGSIELPDGTGRGSTGCCFREPREGTRYRMELREALDDRGLAVGWDYIWYPGTSIHHALVLPLATRGPISMAAAGPREEVGPECPGIPLPGSFETNREAILWANTQGYRWDQSALACDGAQPCDVAAPHAAMDHNMALPADCEESQTFAFVFGDAARLISSGAILSGTWGVHAPGVMTNPVLLTKCDTTKDDDSRNCIALDVPRPDLGGANDQYALGGLNGRTQYRKKATMKSSSWPTLREAMEIDITLSADIAYGDVCELYAGSFSYTQLVTHELGHAFGLAHTDDACRVNMLESQKARWGAHESARFRVLYPSHELDFPDNLYTRP